MSQVTFQGGAPSGSGSAIVADSGSATSQTQGGAIYVAIPIGTGPLLTAGQPIYIDGTRHGQARAGANYGALARVLGIAVPSTLGGFQVQIGGVATLTTAEWDAVIEGGVSSTGLTPGSWYYVGATAGKITTGVPVPGSVTPESTSSSPIGARLGYALSPTELFLSIGDVPLTINLPNNGAALGMPVVLDQPMSLTVVTPGQADQLSTSQIAGIAGYIDANGNVIVFTSGMVLDLTAAQWDARGTSGGLSPGVAYYLSAAAPGAIVATNPPAAMGDYAVLVGVGLSATMLLVQIGAPVGPHA